MTYKSKDWYESDLEEETELKDMDYASAIADSHECLKLLNRLAEFDHDRVVSNYALAAHWEIQKGLKLLNGDV